ncbi:MAG: short-chain dehydrogenase 32, chloroplastic isoform, partial [Myxococcaceae bacterium]|nr:short-chain dehydrogenase 32, chloroplastic isoform [Myxococcaceae bacterium]
RVVMLSSAAHAMAPTVGIQFDDLSFEHGYSKWGAYGQSKLANLLFARSLARKLKGSSRTSNAVHPGVIETNLGRHLNVVAKIAFPIGSALAMKNVAEGAATQCYVATHPSLENVTGEYFADSNLSKSSRLSRDEALADKLWTVTEQIVAGL